MGALDHLGNVKSPTRQIAAEVANAINLPDYPSPYNSPVIWGYNADGAEHGTGRALDFMVRSPGATGDAVAEYLWRNRERFGVIHLIWKQRIRSTRVQPGVWRRMGDRGSPTNNHMDHIHVLFDGRSVSGGGAQSVPAPSSRPTEKFFTPKGVDMSVKAIQKAAGVKADGMYGDDTKAAVKKLQKSLGVPADGLWGPVSEEAYENRNSPKPEPGGGRNAPKFPLPSGHYFGPQSGPASSVSGYHGNRNHLKTWQRRMKSRGWSISVDGLYGPQTAKIVKQFQREKGLDEDGLIGSETWTAAWTAPVT